MIHPSPASEINELSRLWTHIKPVEMRMATQNNIPTLLQNLEWLHLACHGTLKPGKPFDSYFSLAEGSRPARVSPSLMLFVFIWTTPSSRRELPEGSIYDEVIHLAAAMQFCGFRSVVGTMWEMADRDGPDLVKDFYSYVFAKKDPARWRSVGMHAKAFERGD